MDTVERRRDILRANIDIATLRGLEFGVLNRPTVNKAEGNILYADHAVAAELRHKYRDHASVDVSTICEVDIVCNEEGLAGRIPARSIDYVIASHVMEHIPDPVSWLRDIQEILTPSGELRMVLPDKRFSGDLLRRESSPAEVLDAYLTKLRRPRTLQILDCALSVTNTLYHDVYTGKVTNTDSLPLHPPAKALEVAREALEKGEYLDVHCWVFTPESFARNMGILVETGLVSMECSQFVDTQYEFGEFLVFLKPYSDRQAAAESWHRMQQQAEAGLQLALPGTDKYKAIELTHQNDKLQHQLQTKRDEIETLRNEIETLRSEIGTLRSEIEIIRNSTSWRITSPIRKIRHLLRLPCR
jgi:SAM-dependent methyltransferase